MNERILIVDDTPVNVQILTGILKEKGYQLSIGTNGKQGLQVLEKVRPDLILLDVKSVPVTSSCFTQTELPKHSMKKIKNLVMND